MGYVMFCRGTKKKKKKRKYTLHFAKNLDIDIEIDTIMQGFDIISHLFVSYMQLGGPFVIKLKAFSCSV